MEAGERGRETYSSSEDSNFNETWIIRPCLRVNLAHVVSEDVGNVSRVCRLNDEL